MTAAASPALARPGERFARRVVTGCAVLVVTACFGFSFGNVLALGRQLAVPAYVAWLIAPAVDLTVVGLIVGVRHLSLRGIEGARLRPARLLLVAAGLATWALNTAHAVFVRRHLGVAAYDSLAPLLLICWAEVGPWFLRQFRAAGTSNPSSGARTGRTAEAPTRAAAAADHPALGVRVRPTGDPGPPGRAAAAAVAARPPADARQARVAGEQALLERARTLNAAHWQAHGRQISRDKLRAALGIGATRAERLLAALAADPPTGSPPANSPEPAPPAAAVPARPGQWAALPMPRVAGRQGDGDHG
jgi:hypothetical protein